MSHDIEISVGDDLRRPDDAIRNCQSAGFGKESHLAQPRRVDVLEHIGRCCLSRKRLEARRRIS
jgi:hypothetical protein